MGSKELLLTLRGEDLSTPPIPWARESGIPTAWNGSPLTTEPGTPGGPAGPTSPCAETTRMSPLYVLPPPPAGPPPPLRGLCYPHKPMAPLPPLSSSSAVPGLPPCSSQLFSDFLSLILIFVSRSQELYFPLSVHPAQGLGLAGDFTDTRGSGSTIQ